MKPHFPNKTGKIIPHGVKPEPQELNTIIFYTERGEDVEIVVPSNTPHAKTADYFIHGLIWEAKSPTGSNHRTIERIFYQASRQSGNIIMDLRRLKKQEAQVVSILEMCFKNTRRVRNMHIITKAGELKVYKK